MGDLRDAERALAAEQRHKPKAYIAGPMRGIEDFNFPAFDQAAADLREAGFEVFNPAERDREVYGDTLKTPTGSQEDVPQFSLREALAADLSWICENAEVVFVLGGWEESSGAKAEVGTARALGIPVAWASTRHPVMPKPEDGAPETIELEASRLVRNGPRQKTYGHPRGDFDRVAGMWSALLGIRVTAEDVAVMMIAFKLARLKQTPQHRDSKVDVIGYAICLDRLDEEPELPEWEREFLEQKAADEALSQLRTKLAAA